MSTKYLIVRIENAKEYFPENPVFVGGQLVWPENALMTVRKAIHDATKEHMLRVADVVTSGPNMTLAEEKAVELIFERALGRARNGESVRRRWA